MSDMVEADHQFELSVTVTRNIDPTHGSHVDTTAMAGPENPRSPLRIAAILVALSVCEILLASSEKTVIRGSILVTLANADSRTQVVSLHCSP